MLYNTKYTKISTIPKLPAILYNYNVRVVVLWVWQFLADPESIGGRSPTSEARQTQLICVGGVVIIEGVLWLRVVIYRGRPLVEGA